jgi:hypothetical protein
MSGSTEQPPGRSDGAWCRIAAKTKCFRKKGWKLTKKTPIPSHLVINLFPHTAASKTSTRRFLLRRLAGAADAAVVHLDDLLLRAQDQGIVNTHFT